MKFGEGLVVEKKNTLKYERLKWQNRKRFVCQM